jgi:hypothetical protein
MATCPSGHQSATDDFCDVCGYLITAAPSLSAVGPGPAGSSQPDPNATVAGPLADACPRCGAPRFGQFCESCGYDFADPGPVAAPPVPPGPVPPGMGPGAVAGPLPSEPVAPLPSRPAAGPPVGPAGTAAVGTEWTALVTADRAYYDSVQAEGGPDAPGIAFPAYYAERRFRLSGAEVRIGRHSAHSGIEPEIDLAVAPADPGVSRLHAVLIRAADGTWAVVDPGSANGTLVNGTEIPCHTAVPLQDGDRIHLGAWTELRVLRET